MTRRPRFAAVIAAAACSVAVPVTLAASDVPPFGSDGTPSPSLASTARGRQDRAGRGAGQLPGGARVLPTAVVAVGPARARIPRSYLGLSIEYWGLPLFVKHLAAFARVLSLLHVRGDGPLILRVGGDSADRSLWNPGAPRMPPWVFRLNGRWLQATNLLLQRLPLRLIMDLNLVTASPLRAAAWARAAESRLRHGSIAAFEIGNEPDIYDRPYWLATITRSAPGAAALPAAISPRSYVRDFAAYARDMRRFASGVPLMGPAVATPTRSLGWIRLLALHGRPWLGALSAHRYPYSACLGPASPYSPTVPRLLSDFATSSLVAAVRPAVQVAHRAGLPLRMTELNSVTCGGRAGVSNTFATALWAPDAMFELLRAGVDGVSIHVRADTVNAAVVPTRHGLRARPLLYGLALFTRCLAAGGRLLGSSVRSASIPAGRLKAWAVRAPDGQTRVLLINKGGREVRVQVRLRGSADAMVQRLLAPSASSTRGETLGGQWLSSDGRWRGRVQSERVALRAGGYTLRLPAVSAALIRVP